MYSGINNYRMEDCVSCISFCNISQVCILNLVIMDGNGCGTLVKIVNMEGSTKAMCFIQLSLRYK